MPMPAADPTSMGISHGADHGMASDFADSTLKYGSSTTANRIASEKERKLNNKDSVRNCQTRLPLSEPTTLRRPTSLARLADLAVDRLMKLMHARIKIKMATAPNSQTKRISPFSRPVFNIVRFEMNISNRLQQQPDFYSPVHRPACRRPVSS